MGEWIKKNVRMNLEYIMLSKVCETQRDKYHIISLIRGI